MKEKRPMKSVEITHREPVTANIGVSGKAGADWAVNAVTAMNSKVTSDIQTSFQVFPSKILKRLSCLLNLWNRRSSKNGAEKIKA